MSWSIAQAKQRFSELIRKAPQEPQLIYNRSRLATAVVSAEEFSRFEQWRTAQKQRSLAEECDELRTLLAEEDYCLPAPVRENRANVFAERIC